MCIFLYNKVFKCKLPIWCLNVGGRKVQLCLFRQYWLLLCFVNVVKKKGVNLRELSGLLSIGGFYLYTLTW